MVTRFTDSWCLAAVDPGGGKGQDKPHQAIKANECRVGTRLFLKYVMGLEYFALFKIGCVLPTDLKLIWNFANFVQGPGLVPGYRFKIFFPQGK